MCDYFEADMEVPPETLKSHWQEPWSAYNLSSGMATKSKKACIGKHTVYIYIKKKITKIWIS